MTEVHYRNAPIVEAVIDLRVRFRNEPTFEALLKCAARFRDRFPVQEELHQVQVNLQVGSPVKKMSGKRSKHRIGLRLRSADGQRVLLIQKVGFAYSQLAPYSDWNTFRSEARECWSLYREALVPQIVERHAVRFINKISVPGGWSRSSAFVNLFPTVPPQLLTTVSGYFMQLQMPQTHVAPNTQLIINSGIGEVEQSGAIGLMLDFDLFAQAEIDPSSDLVWECLDVLRKRKNEVFEACITDETRRLIS